MTVRIQPNENPNQKTKELYDSIEKKLGRVPNIFKTFGHSQALLKSYLDFSGALATGKLSGALREQIALTVAGANSCDYCASAHTALAQMNGVSKDESTLNLNANSEDAKTKQALRFAKSIIAKEGFVSDEDLKEVRSAGYSEEEIVEIIGVVALNIFTNYFNHIAGTEIDFPLVDTKNVGKAA